jgi:hypothetical protein
MLALCTVATAQTDPNTTLTKIGRVAPKPTPPNAGATDADKLAVDFQNFKYLEPGRTSAFQLKNGVFSGTDRATGTSRSFQFRKTYYFDLTADKKTEAVVHILADTCDFCEERSLFYAFSAIGGSPLQLFSIATGSAAKCGLKEAAFDAESIAFEVFGDCEFTDSVFRPVTEPVKDVATRIELEWKDGKLETKNRASLPFPEKDIAAHSRRIRFGAP